MPESSPLSHSQENAQLRQWIYALLIIVAVGMAAGRILNTERVYEPTLYRDPDDKSDTRGNWPSSRPDALPTFSSNDRSRWATIRALVDHHTYVIGERDMRPVLPSVRDRPHRPTRGCGPAWISGSSATCAGGSGASARV